MSVERTDAVDFLREDPLATADRLEALAADLRKLADGEVPSAARMRDAPILRRWGLERRPAVALAGTACGHPKIGDGRPAVTSEVFAIARDRSWVRTMSRFYSLGPPGVFGVED